MRHLILLVVLFAALLQTACRKDLDQWTGGPDAVVFVTSTVYGVVTGAQQQPLAGVQVRLGNQQRVTDENGYFFIPAGPMDSRGAVLHFSRPGYLDISKTVLPVANGRTSVELTMSVRALRGTVPAQQGGTVVIQGASVQLPSGGIVRADGQAYSGDVLVYGVFLDPADPGMHRRMPGNLSAVRSDGRPAVLATFGMLGVELESPAGEKLQLAPGARAGIRIPLAPTFQAAAPATIPLWHFDDTNGRWMEEGMALLEGSAYVGEVSHFSFWNVDVPFDAVKLSGRVISAAQEPLAGMEVRAIIQGGNGSNFPNGAFASAFTGPDGQFCGWVPAGMSLLLEVRTTCGTLLSSTTVGPLNADFDLGNWQTAPAAELLTVSGRLTDCNGDPLPQPSYVLLELNGKKVFIPSDADGLFSTTLVRCSNAAQLLATAFDVPGLKQGETQSVMLAGEDVIDLGDLTACIALQAFISYKLDDKEVLLLDVRGDVHSPDEMSIDGWGPDSSLFYLLLPMSQPGQTQEAILSLNHMDPQTFTFYNITCQCMGLTVTVEEVGAVGEFISGHFHGLVPVNNAGPMVGLTGQFRVPRIN